MLNSKKIKKQFPIFNAPENKDLVYLDNAATTQKPREVIDAISNYYSTHNSNIHRGLYPLAQRADSMYDEAKSSIRKFFNAEGDYEVIFTKGTTEGINLVAHSMGNSLLKKGDNIAVSILEHHSNFIPWQEKCKEKEANFNIIYNPNDFIELKAKINSNTKIVAITQMSNTLGNIVDLSSFRELTDRNKALLLVDGAQSVASMPINLNEMNPDFFVFSGHKIFGPTGIGVVLAKNETCASMNPYQVGGDVIYSVDEKDSIYSDFPSRMEAGTPNIAGAIGLSAALKFVQGIDRENIHTYLVALRKYAFEELSKLTDVSIIGYHDYGCSIISFNVNGVHPHDVATLLAQENISIRAGHHCTQPLFKFLGIQASVRASFSIYNNEEDVDKLVAGIKKIRTIFKSS